MATYITSDAHGHLRALDQALEQAAPGADDTVYVLGDMIDRGPEPVGVINLVRSLPNVHVLMGNHERLDAQRHRARKPDGYLYLGAKRWLHHVRPV